MKSFITPKGTELPLLDLRDKPYLQVAHRIVWFRENHPDWLMSVEIVEKTSECVTAKALIYDENEKLRAVAHKVEHYKHFPDALEKAETGAIGRALAMLGFGTQFAPEISEEDRIVDSPIDQVKKTSQPKPIQKAPIQSQPVMPEAAPLDTLTNWADRAIRQEINPGNSMPPPVGRPAVGPKGISEKQQFRLFKIQEKANWSVAELMTYLRDTYKVTNVADIPWNVYNDICSHIEMNPNQSDDNIPF